MLEEKVSESREVDIWFGIYRSISENYGTKEGRYGIVYESRASFGRIKRCLQIVLQSIQKDYPSIGENSWNNAICAFQRYSVNKAKAKDGAMVPDQSA